MVTKPRQSNSLAKDHQVFLPEYRTQLAIPYRTEHLYVAIRNHVFNVKHIFFFSFRELTTVTRWHAPRLACSVYILLDVLAGSLSRSAVYYLTHSMEQSPSWVPNRYRAIQEIPSPRLHPTFKDPCHCYPPNYAWVLQVVSFPQKSSPQSCMNLSCHLNIPHAPFSFNSPWFH